MTKQVQQQQQAQRELDMISRFDVRSIYRNKRQEVRTVKLGEYPPHAAMTEDWTEVWTHVQSTIYENENHPEPGTGSNWQALCDISSRDDALRTHTRMHELDKRLERAERRVKQLQQMTATPDAHGLDSYQVKIETQGKHKRQYERVLKARDRQEAIARAVGEALFTWNIRELPDHCLTTTQVLPQDRAQG